MEKLSKNINNIKDFIKRITVKLYTDLFFRNRFFLYIGIIINSAFIVFYLICGYVYMSLWFFTIAVYYILLGGARLFISRKERIIRNENPKIKAAEEFHIYRVTGLFLLVINLVISGIGMMVIIDGKGYTYTSLVIYAVALNAFFHLGLVIRRFIVFRKYDSYLLHAVSSINLAAALMGIFTLQTSMIKQFGDHRGGGFSEMNMITLTGIFIILTVRALYMLLKKPEEGIEG